MTSHIFHLFQLQKNDSRRDAINDRLKNIDFIIKNDSRLDEPYSVLLENKKRLSDHKASLLLIENNVKAKKLKMEQSESSLYSGTIKNPKELQDLQKEIAYLKSSVTNLENGELDLWGIIEADEVEITSAEQNYNAVYSQIQTSNSMLISEQENLRSELSKLSSERQVIVEQVPDELLKIYEDLRIKKKGIAISRIEEENCSACGSTLTPAERQLAKAQNSIFNCSSCGRILYGG